MKKYILILLTFCCTALAACSGDQGKQQLETAQFEEKQNNRDHAIKMYEEVVAKHADTPNARIARERLNTLKGASEGAHLTV